MDQPASSVVHPSAGDAGAPGARSLLPGRNMVIGMMAFLTVVDLFAAQAILPALRDRYGATPAAMSVAVNASTIGMAAAGLITAVASRRIAWRGGVVASLMILALPTLLLAHAPDIGTFGLLRVAQGCCMATAFTLTLAYIGESSMSPQEAASAFAAYVTGNVASNLFGRMMSSGLAESLGLSVTFYAFAALNLAGAALAAVVIRNGRAMSAPRGPGAIAGLAALVRDRRMAAAFLIGFCILFAFIGVFTFVNFVLARPPFTLGPMWLGVVCLVFAPSIVTTAAVGRVVASRGTTIVLVGGLAVALVGAGLLAIPYLGALLAGLMLVAIGTFAAQAVATGYVGRTASGDRTAASGLYLASYFTGGLAGTALLGQLFDAFGWGACLAGVAAALIVAAAAAPLLRDPERA